MAQYSGVVRLKLVIDGSKHLYGSAVFISSDTLVTTAHVIGRLKSPVKENLFFTNPKTNESVPITHILHLDYKYDLAVLKTENYSSDVFYSMSKDRLDHHQQVLLVGFPKTHFHIIKGQVLAQPDFFLDRSVARIDGIDQISGASGGAVFDTDTGQLVGIIMRELGVSSYIQFVSTEQIKQLLLKTPLSCIFENCVKKQIAVLRAAAQNDDMIAQYELSRWYQSQENKKQYLYWLHRAAQNDFAFAQFDLGLLLERDEKDIDGAISLYKAAAKKDFITVQYTLGIALLKKSNYKDAFHWIKIAAEQGFFKAQFTLGMFYYYGIGVDVDYKKAAVWIKKVADIGDSLAQFQLGLQYHFGEGVQQDDIQAVYWIKQAAEQGLDEAKQALLMKKL